MYAIAGYITLLGFTGIVSARSGSRALIGS